MYQPGLFSSYDSAPLPLHAPDGFFSLPVAVAGYVVSGAVVALAARLAGRRLQERTVPLMGVMAAFVFAAQMLNFPIAGGTSGHLIGGALLAVLLGPWAAVLVMTAVVGLQALIFQDGGLVVLGVNVFNMGVLTTLGGYAAYRGVRVVLGSGRRGLLVGGFAAAWLSVVAAAVAAAFELSLSGTSPLMVALPAMAGVHALIGLAEGAITVAALSFILSVRRDLLGLPMMRSREVANG
ncbi:MAG: energy-coupling factor ABC transporter permease [Chloroflexota bacterium]|nr:energy-coupling factor ABC transporter permease [Chloroflexota bacterium]